MTYIDSSALYLDSIYVCKNILKGLVYCCLGIFTFFESKLNNKISKLIKNIKKVDYSKQLWYNMHRKVDKVNLENIDKKYVLWYNTRHIYKGGK